MAKSLLNLLPFYGSFERGMGAVTRFQAIPCATPAAVYIEASVHAFWKFAYTLLSPDPKEIYHQLIGNSLYHDLKGSAESLSIVDPVAESKVTRALFLLADTIDIALWTGFVFASFVEGLVDFSTQVKVLDGCLKRNNPDFFQGGPYITAIADDGNYYAPLFAGSWGDGTMAAGPAFSRMRGGQGGFVAASCSYGAFGSDEVVPSATAVINTLTTEVLDFGASAPNDENVNTLGHAFYKLKNGKTTQVDLEIRSAYLGEHDLPLHEMFRIPAGWNGYALNPNRF